MRKLFAFALVFGLGAHVLAAEPQHFPARASEIEAIKGLQAEARELDEARRRLEARAQLVLEEARERLHIERGVDLRYDPEKRVFFVAEIAPASSSSTAPVSSR